MAGFRLALKRLPDGRLVFSVPLTFKLLLLAIGILILVSLIVTAPEQWGGIFVGANTAPLIICLLSFLGAAYHERWIFDRKHDRIIYQLGIIILHSNRLHRISRLERVEVSWFVKGKSGSAQPARRGFGFRTILTLSLEMKDGKVLRLENYRGSQRLKVEATARAIARYCGIRYVNDVQDPEEP